jgi:vitamin B12 transporter
MIRFICTLILLFSALFCRSQNSIELDPISVTSSRVPQKNSETGRFINVIDGKLIEHLPVSSLDDLLKYTNAVEVQQRGPAGSQADIVVRGGTFQQVLVLIDGIKINDPITGHFNAYIPLAASQISRIEILKGPAAAMYGSEAVGAVINIISKTFADGTSEKNTHLNGSVAAGEYGYLAANAGVYHTDKKINYSVAAQHSAAAGQLLRGTNRGRFNNNLVSANASMELKGNWKLLLHSSYDSRNFAAQNFYTSFVSDTATEKVNTWWNHFKLKKSTAASSQELDIAYKNTSDHYLYNPLSTANDNESGLFSVQYLRTSQFNKNLSYNYGLMAESKNIRSNDRGNHQNKHIAGFGSMIIKAKKITVNPGLRLAYDENYGTKLLPQANINYRYKHLVLKANAGKSIRAADFTERYNNYNKRLVSGGSIGQPSLQNERSWSCEAGADLYFQDIKISSAWFYRNQADVIDWVNTPYADMPRKINLVATGNYALAKNIKKVNTSGVEFQAEYTHRYNKRQEIYLQTSATFIHSTSGDSVPSFYIISHARFLTQQTLSYTYKPFRISINSLYKQRSPQQAAAIKASISKDYWIVNARLEYNYRFVTAFAVVNNIGNIQYSDLLGSKMPGSWSMAGFSVAW